MRKIGAALALSGGALGAASKLFDREVLFWLGGVIAIVGAFAWWKGTKCPKCGKSAFGWAIRRAPVTQLTDNLEALTLGQYRCPYCGIRR